MIEYKLRYRVDFSCYCFIISPFTEIMLPFFQVSALWCMFCYFLSSIFQICFNFQFLADDIVPTRASFLSLDSQAYLQHHTTTHDKSSRTEKKGVRFFLNICSLLCSRVFSSLSVGFCFWPENVPFDICWLSQICWPKNPFLTNNTLSHPHLLGPKRTAGH